MRTLEEVDADIAETKRQIALGNAFNRRAARFDYILEGDRSGLDAIANAVNNAVAREAQQKFQAEQNELSRKNALEIALMNKTEAEAERKRKEEELRGLKLAQARPEYLSLEKQMLDAAELGNLDEAAIYKSRMEALEKEHGAKFGENAQGLIDARDKARIEKQKREADEGQRRLNVANFKATIPTTFATEADKIPWYKAVNDSQMTPEEKAEEIERIRNTKSGETKNQESVQGANANYSGKKTTEKLEQKDNDIATAKAWYKRTKGDKNRPATKAERAAVANCEKNGWEYK